MFVVEMINDILQSIYVYVPQELVILILACVTMLIIESVKNGKNN